MALGDREVSRREKQKKGTLPVFGGLLVGLVFGIDVEPFVLGLEDLADGAPLYAKDGADVFLASIWMLYVVETDLLAIAVAEALFAVFRTGAHRTGLGRVCGVEPIRGQGCRAGRGRGHARLFIGIAGGPGTGAARDFVRRCHR